MRLALRVKTGTIWVDESKCKHQSRYRNPDPKPLHADTPHQSACPGQKKEGPFVRATARAMVRARAIARAEVSIRVRAEIHPRPRLGLLKEPFY